LAPAAAEDATNVPVHVKVVGLGKIAEVHVLADYNPIVKALVFYPGEAEPSLGFRLKVQQSTPIRAVVKTSEGKWYSGVHYIEAAGGGCTAPSFGTQAEWKANLGKVQSRRFMPMSNGPELSEGRTSDAAVRVRFRVSHPMDTGLAPGIPALYIEELNLLDAKNNRVSRIESFEPVSENPVYSLDLPKRYASEALQLVGKDNQGNKVGAYLQ
ncbi:MAG: hypothetical protein RLZZ502_1438, partial [Pseudomonadota bacterium]